MPITRVWIEPGCIRCGWCQHLEPRVFLVTAAGSIIVAAARMDGRDDANHRGGSDLRPQALDDEARNFLQFIADGCPVQVIRVDGAGVVDPTTGLAVGRA